MGGGTHTGTDRRRKDWSSDEPTPMPRADDRTPRASGSRDRWYGRGVGRRANPDPRHVLRPEEVPVAMHAADTLIALGGAFLVCGLLARIGVPEQERPRPGARGRGRG